MRIHNSEVNIPFILTIVWLHLMKLTNTLKPLLIKFDLEGKLEGWLRMNKSRKLFLLYVVLVLATLGAFAPPLTVWICQICGKNVPPFSILGSTEWVSMISLVVTTYFGSNVWEKHVALSNGVPPSQIDNACINITPQGSGQQVQPNQSTTTDADKEALVDALKHGQ
jgi:hypothetical protein